MKVLVDSTIWSLWLRRPRTKWNARQLQAVNELEELIRANQAELLGLVRQEVLSGIRGPEKFEEIRGSLQAFADVLVDTKDYEEAARYYNRCVTRGVAARHIDLLICAVGKRRGWAVFTSDGDFGQYRNVVDVKLFRDKVYSL